MILLSSPSDGTTARSTSILQKNTKLYGPMNAIDLSNKSSCWNSDGTMNGDTCISFILDFHRVVFIKELRLQFQGGFAAKELNLFTILEDPDNVSVQWRQMKEDAFEPHDSNDMQIFSLFQEEAFWKQCTSLRIDFNSSTDFYGRITLYQIQVWGEERS